MDPSDKGRWLGLPPHPEGMTDIHTPLVFGMWQHAQIPTLASGPSLFACLQSVWHAQRAHFARVETVETVVSPWCPWHRAFRGSEQAESITAKKQANHVCCIHVRFSGISMLINGPESSTCVAFLGRMLLLRDARLQNEPTLLREEPGALNCLTVERAAVFRLSRKMLLFQDWFCFPVEALFLGKTAHFCACICSL